jgi:phosphoglycolate phosphatase
LSEVSLAGFDTVLLDLDGTLTDPTEGITNSIAHALRQMGAPVPPRAQLAATIGPPLRDAFAQFLHTDDRGQIERAVALYRERFAPIGLYENAVYPGIDAALSALRAKRMRLILATSKPHIYARRILEHFSLDHYFAAVHGSELDGTREKKSEVIAYLLQKESVDPGSAVMVGDRAVDISGARANGMAGIGVLWGFGSQDELSAAAPLAILNSPADLAMIGG